MRIDGVTRFEVIDHRRHDREHHNHEHHGWRHAVRAYSATGDSITVVIAEQDDGRTIKIFLSDLK